jgi:hypothetical protein
MADLKDVLRHLITHAEGYATAALRQEHLDAVGQLDGPAPVPAEAVTEAVTGEGA